MLCVLCLFPEPLGLDGGGRLEEMVMRVRLAPSSMGELLSAIRIVDCAHYGANVLQLRVRQAAQVLIKKHFVVQVRQLVLVRLVYLERLLPARHLAVHLAQDNSGKHGVCCVRSTQHCPAQARAFCLLQAF